VQVANANVAEWKELRGLMALREEVGELSAADERKLAQLRAAAERAVLAEADVICCTCVAAADRRLSSMRFHRVRASPLPCLRSPPLSFLPFASTFSHGPSLSSRVKEWDDMGG
jgi:AAA domain